MTQRRERMRGHRKPVAVVTATIPATIYGFDREVIRQIQAQGYDVCVVSSPDPELGKVRDEMGVRIRALRMAREISPLTDLLALMSWLWVCLAERPSLIVSATPKASLLSLLAARTTRVERRLYCLVGLRLEGERGRKRQLLAFMEEVTSWASTEVVANSPSLAARYAELHLASPRKLRQTRPGSDHGVDTGYFSPRLPDLNLAGVLRIDRSVPVVGLVGRLTRDKGVETLIDAMGLLHADGIACQLLVVGAQDEPDSEAFLNTLKSMGDRVVAVGAVDETAGEQPVRPVDRIVRQNRVLRKLLAAVRLRARGDQRRNQAAGESVPVGRATRARRVWLRLVG